jgi:hypothetical protein
MGCKSNSLTVSTGSGAIGSCCFSRIAEQRLLGVRRNGAPSGNRDGANVSNKFTSIHSFSLIFRYRPETLAWSGMSVNTRRLEIRMGQLCRDQRDRCAVTDRLIRKDAAKDDAYCTTALSKGR